MGNFGIFMKVLFLLMMVDENRGAKEICPKMCTCDIYEGLKRADCSDQNLASPYTNVATSVEILNLSENEITTIDNDCLKDYKELIKLSFARNSIHNIELFAFETLKKLNYLDLSDNRLEVIDNRMLETVVKLTFLDLSKNKFMMTSDSPLIISESLEFLSLRNSHLSHVHETFFSQLPNLIDLDLSNNLLNTLIPAAFEPLDSLQFINIEYNRFSCDHRIEETLQMFKQRKVHVKIDKCVKNSKKPMFEKMILHPDVTTESPREDVEIELIWGSEASYKKLEVEENGEKSTGFLTYKEYYEKIKAESANEDSEEFDCDDDEMFPSTCECRHKYIKYYESIEKFKPIHKWNLEIRMATIFYLGIFLGMLGGSLLYFCISIIRKKCRKANKKQMERQRARERLIQTTCLEESLPVRTPLPALRNQLIPTNAPQPEILYRSPVPTPRNQNNQNSIDSPNPSHSTNLINFSRTSNSPSVSRRIEPLPRTSSPMVARRIDSAETRRRTEAPRNRISVPQNSRFVVEPSPTAVLLQKLFRNRDPLLLPERSEMSSVTPSSIRSQQHQVPALRIEEEVVYMEVPSLADPDDDSGSEYLSIDDLNYPPNLDDLRSESSTPPPAYRSIFDDDK